MQRRTWLMTIASRLLWIFTFLWLLLITERSVTTYIRNGDEYITGIIAIAIPALLILVLIVNVIAKVRSEWLKVGLLFLIALLLRFVAIKVLNTQPISDFSWYLDYALGIAESKNIELAAFYFGQHPELFSFVLWEALLMAIFGRDLSVLQYANMFIGALTAILIYLLGKKIHPRIGIVSSLLFSIAPSSLALTPVLSNQHFSLLLYLAAYILILNNPFPEKDGYQLLRYLIIGILIGLGQLIRPDGLIPLSASVIFLVLSPPVDLSSGWAGKIPPRIRSLLRPLVFCVVIILGYIMPMNAYYSVAKFNRANVRYYNTITMFHKLTVGLNLDTRGIWNLPDADHYQAMLDSKDMDASILETKILIAQRAKSVIPLLTLFSDKIDTLWVDDDTTIEFATEDVFSASQEETINALPSHQQESLIRDKETWIEELINIFYSADSIFRIVIYLGAVLYLWNTRKNLRREAVFFMIIFAIYSGLHIIIEVQERYRYFMLPVFVLFAAPFITPAVDKMIEKTAFLKPSPTSEEEVG